jgi:hypothetical protein
LLVLSHPHEDHVGGLALLLARYQVSRIVEPGMRGPGPGYRAWAARLAAEGKTTARLATGDRFEFDDIAFRVLWPDRGSVPADPPDTGTGINNVSIVLLGTFGRERLLLAGDIEEGIDPILLSRGLPRVDLLKVAHHGSRTSSTQAFLDAVAPRIAVVSVGAKNTYGHPAPETIARLRSHRAAVYRTDQDGSVVVTLDGTAAVARAEGGRVASEASPSNPGVARPRVGNTGIESAVVRNAFACGIPGAAIRLAANAKTSAAGTEPAGTRTSAAITSPTTGRSGALASRPSATPGTAAVLLYHRADDGTRAGRRRRPASFARPKALGTPARARGRRGGRLARPPH